MGRELLRSGLEQPWLWADHDAGELDVVKPSSSEFRCWRTKDVATYERLVSSEPFITLCQNCVR